MAGRSPLETLVAAATAAGLRIAVAEAGESGLAAGLRRLAPASVFVGGVRVEESAEELFGEADAVRRMAEAVRRRFRADLGLAVGPARRSGPAGWCHVGASLGGHVVARRHRCRSPGAGAERAAGLGLELISYLGFLSAGARTGLMAGTGR